MHDLIDFFLHVPYQISIRSLHLLQHDERQLLPLKPRRPCLSPPCRVYPTHIRLTLGYENHG